MSEVSAGSAPSGPLSGLRVLEFAGPGPAPFACMLLADMGAQVVRIERPAHAELEHGITLRGRSRLELDLKNPESLQSVKSLAASADVLVEGFRPGVMERLGLGPAEFASSNPRLVYARMTGWGQDGPRANSAGHDINFISVTGALDAIGSSVDGPSVPLNLVGDYGGGALYLVMGILAALLDARATGRGQTVDCAICDGTASMTAIFHQLRNDGAWRDARQANVIDGGAHYYGTYECADGRYVAVGAIEPQFYAQLRQVAGWSDPAFDLQDEPEHWADLKQRAAALFKQHTRDEWTAIFADTDCCVTPVLTFEESLRDPHLLVRETFTTLEGVAQPAPAPRFLKTPSAARPSRQVSDAAELIAQWASTVDL